MIFSALYYLFISSAVLVYGIGINDSIILCDSIHKAFLPIIKIFVTILSTVMLSWLLITKLLVPLNLAELYPLVALLVFIVISILLESLVRITSNRVTSEFCLSFPIVLLTLNEGISFSDILIISTSSFLSFVIILPVIYSIKKRINIVGNQEIHGNRKSLIMISLAILSLVLILCNISWLNPGVIP